MEKIKEWIKTTLTAAIAVGLVVGTQLDTIMEYIKNVLSAFE